MESPAEHPSRNVLLRNEATVALKDFNSVAQLGLTLPSNNLDASPIVAEISPRLLRYPKKPLPVGEGLKGVHLGRWIS